MILSHTIHSLYLTVQKIVWCKKKKVIKNFIDPLHGGNWLPCQTPPWSKNLHSSHLLKKVQQFSQTQNVCQGDFWWINTVNSPVNSHTRPARVSVHKLCSTLLAHHQISTHIFHILQNALPFWNLILMLLFFFLMNHNWLFLFIF